MAPNFAETWLWRSALSAAVLSLALWNAQVPAAAYSGSTNGCNDDSLYWQFDGANWTSAKMTAVRAAFNTVDNPLDYDGTKLVTIGESTGGLLVSLKDAAIYEPGSTYGNAKCTAGLTSTI